MEGLILLFFLILSVEFLVMVVVEALLDYSGFFRLSLIPMFYF